MGGQEMRIRNSKCRVRAVTTAVSLAGPHATMKIKDDKGQIWDLTLAPPARTSEAGLKEGTIPVGAKVSIHGHRNSDPRSSRSRPNASPGMAKRSTSIPIAHSVRTSGVASVISTGPRRALIRRVGVRRHQPYPYSRCVLPLRRRSRS